MNKHKRNSKTLAMILAVIMLFGMIPCSMGTAVASYDKKETYNENGYTTSVDLEPVTKIQETQTDSQKVNSMTFAGRNLYGKSVVIDAQTSEMMVREHSRPDRKIQGASGSDKLIMNRTNPNTNQKSDEHTNFADSVALLLDEFDTQDFFTTIVLTADDPTMVKSGETVDVIENEQVAPMIEDDVLMAPLDMLVDNAGAQAGYVFDEETIKITTEEEEIEISIADGSVSDSYSTRWMMRNPCIIEDQVFVPLKDIAGILGYNVELSGDVATLSRPFQTKRLIVKAYSEIDSYGAVAVVRSPDNLFVLQYETETEAKKALEKYSTEDDIEFAQTDNIVKTTEFNPLSWGVARMNAPTYQNFLYDSCEKLPEIVVGVLDTGIDPDHPHFEGRIIPNDYDYTSSASNSYDGYFHGTHVAGTIVDATPPNVKVQPYKVLDNYGGGSDITVYLGIIAAADNGVDVINMSLGGYGTSELIYNAVMYAMELNIVVVVAAGNDNDDVTKYFPAQIEEAITVAAVDRYDQRAYFSNWGDSIDIAAAGVEVLSSVPGGGYESSDGTSMSTPHVSAAAAMLKTFNKTLAPQHIEAILRNSADDAGTPGWDIYYGDGILNLYDVKVLDVTAPPVFSMSQGWYQDSFELVLTSETEDARIYYTLNGSAPTESSKLYTGPILVTDNGKVRARAFSDGRLSSGVISRLYHVSQFPATMHYTAIEYNDFRWEYKDSNTNTQALKITFDERTDFESADWDIHFMDLGLVLLNENGIAIQSALSGMERYAASELAGKSFYMQGNSFTAMFRGGVTSDTFGFAISNIEPITTPMAQRPTFDLEEEVFYEQQKTITLTAPYANTDIYYTTDGSIPTHDSTMYTDGITISQPTVIKAIAFGQNLTPSYVVSKTYYVSRYPESLHYSRSMDLSMGFPTWECPGYPDYLMVTFSEDSDFGSDGIDATSGWISRLIGENGCGFVELSDEYYENVYNDYDDSPYFKDKQLAGRTIIVPGDKLNIWHFAWVTKNTFGFRIDNIEPVYGKRAQTPVFSVASGYYNTPQSVSISSSTGASIYYTTDGTMPTTGSALYTAPISVLRNQTVRAVAVKEGWLDSAMTKANYYISKFPESTHDQRFSDIFGVSAVWSYEYPDDTVEALDLRFNTKTDFYFMRVYDGDGKEVFYEVMGSEYAGKTIRVPGNKFSIVADFVTLVFGSVEENSASYYGFKIDNINPVKGEINPSLPGGTYDSPIEVEISSPYSSVFYTTDGSAPDNTSKLYTGSISITENTMLKAVGYDGSKYSCMFEGIYYVTKPPESLHYLEGWYDATWEYEFDEMHLIEIVFDERSQCDDILIYTNRNNLIFDNLPIKIQQDQDGRKSVKIFGDYLNMQYLGGFSNGGDFGLKTIALSEIINDVTDAFTDPNFRAAVQEVIGDPCGTIYEHKLAQLSGLYVSDRDIKSLAGIEYMINLRDLYCANNQLTLLPVLPTGLYLINCSNNLLESLDLSNNTALGYLNCRNNLLTSLNVAKKSNLWELDCRLNYLPGKAAITGLNESRTTVWFDPQHQPGDEEPIDIPDKNFKWALIQQGVDKNDDGEISKAEAMAVEDLWVNGYGIIDLTGIENFVILRYLFCYNNKLMSLTGLPSGLCYLDCSKNLLTTIDISNNTALEYLYCKNNLLMSFDVTKNSKLRELDCRLNYLPGKAAITGLNESRTTVRFDPQYQPGDEEPIDIPDKNFKWALIQQGIDKNSDGEISKAEAMAVEDLGINYCGIADLTGINYFISLRYLYCKNNQMKSLPALSPDLCFIDCSNNQLTSLPEIPSDVYYINCSNNQLESIDLLKDSALERLICRNNLLTSLNVTKNSRLGELDCRLNYLPDIAAITGLNESRTTLRFDPQYSPEYEENIIIPDANFFRALIEQGVDKNNDGAISKVEAMVVDNLWVDGYGISDLAGIGYFTMLETLYCANNQLKSLPELPPDLGYIYCSGNQLKSLPEPLPSGMYGLDCANNQLESLPELPPGLSYINCSGNQLKSLPEPLPYGIYGFDCSNNQLKSLPRLPVNMNWLECSGNQLESIDLSGNVTLEYLYCRDNLLTSLNVLKNSRLRELDCRYNYFAGKAAIIGLNETRTTVLFYPQFTPGYEESIVIPDAEFKRALIEYGVDRNNDGEISKAEALIVEYLWISGCGISDLTGIEYFASLLDLDCSNNQLKSLSELPPKIYRLNCADNQLELIDLSNDTALEYLYCKNNTLTSLDVTKNIKLQELDCRFNYLSGKAAIVGLNESRTVLLLAPQYKSDDDDVHAVSADETLLTWNAIAGENLSIDNVLVNLATLPTRGVNGTTITWLSDNVFIVTNSGAVTRPASGSGDAIVKLTAIIKKRTAEKRIEFILTVKEVDKSNLRAAVGAFQELSEGEWTVSSWADAADANQKALNVINNKNASQGEVDTAVRELSTAITRLVHKDTEKEKGNSSSGGVNLIEKEVPLEENPVNDEPVQWTNPLTDVKSGDWFYADVEFACARGLMIGTETDKFDPSMKLTRGTIVTVLYRYAGSTDVSGISNPFSDVPDDMWYTDAILWAVENDIVLGFGNGRFRPNDNITRQDLVVILYRYAGLAKVNLPETLEYQVFRDEADIAGYAKEAIEVFLKAGIITGKPGNLFDPKGTATRAEVAAMLHRFILAAESEQMATF